MRLAEIHSSELTGSCLRKIYHRLNGEVTGATTTALYRGLVAGRAMELLHQQEFDSDPSEITIEAAADTQKTLASENRILTEAVEQNRGDILAEITGAVHLYQDRFGPLFKRCSLIGTELPCRITVDGSVLVYPKAGDMGWVEFNESPTLIWCHLPNLKPYNRKVICKNDSGEEQQYVRGDLRPTRSILHSVTYDDKHCGRITDELKTRAKMIKNDIFPLNPDPVSCRICDAEAFCTRFDMPQI